MEYVYRWFGWLWQLRLQGVNRRWLMIGGAGFLLGSLYYGWIFLTRKPPIVLDTIRVKTVKVVPESLSPEIEALGTVEFFEKVSITSRTAGKIEKILVAEGDLVQKDQVLVQIERLPLELELRKEEAAMEAAAAELSLVEERYYEARQRISARVKEIEKKALEVQKSRADLLRVKALFEGKRTLYKEGGISLQEYRAVRTELVAAEAAYENAKKDMEIVAIGFRKEDIIRRGFAVPEDPQKLAELYVDLNTLKEKAELEVSRSRLRSAKVAVESTKKLLEQTTIRSPIRGIVAVRNKGIGEDASVGTSGVSPEQAILVVVDIDSVYANVKVRESEVKSIAPGMKMNLMTDAFPGEIFASSVRVIKPLIDQKTHTAEIKGIVPNPYLKLRPGMFLRATIITGVPIDTMLVPDTALLPGEGDAAWVYVVRQSRTYRVEVKTGRQVGDRVEIVTGLKPGDRIALEKLAQLKDGMTIEAVDTALEENADAETPMDI